MDQYLTIAERVLRAARQPLSAREILEKAYLDGIVPPHLYGRTQHKTLGARLSEDILLRRSRSAFFRTNPGRYFLRQFLSDPTVPEDFRAPIVARRRERDLHAGDVLALSRDDLFGREKYEVVPKNAVLDILQRNKFRYVHEPDARTHRDTFVWSFVVVVKRNAVLSYRIGRFRDGRDAFLHKRSIGFFRAVTEADSSLFDLEDHGITASGVTAAVLDLDLPTDVMEYQKQAHLDCFFLSDELSGPPNLIALVRFDCPSWFEPTKRRLAINDLNWLDFETPVNHMDDFDPWSQRVLRWLQKTKDPLTRGPP